MRMKLYSLVCGVVILLLSIVSAASDSTQAALLWKSDLNAGSSADFLVRTESKKIAEGPLGLLTDIKIYTNTDDSLQLVYEERDVGEVVGIFHLGQVDSPLVTVSTKTGSFFDVRGYYYDRGKVKKGFEFSSISFPEVVVRKSGGVYVVVRFLDTENKLMTKVFFYYSKNWAKFGGDIPFADRLTGIQKTSNY